jgi:hypothetical protein
VQQRIRKPSYFAKPVIRAQPLAAAEQQSEGAALPAEAATQPQPGGSALPSAAASKKELPPLLRARLAKRGILPQVKAPTVSIAAGA